MIKKSGLLLLLICVVGFLLAQDISALMEEGRKQEMKFKEEVAIDKYSQVLAAEPSNVKALMKMVELSGNIGARQNELAEKVRYYKQAGEYAKRLHAVDSTSAEANYTQAVFFSRMTDVDEKRDSLVYDVRQIRHFAGSAIAADPGMGRAYNVLGRWHYEMLNLNTLKRSAMKLLYGKFPEANIDSAIAYFEKCKALEPYYCQNFYDLGKAYNHKRQYEKAIGILEQLAKLPTRRQDDLAIKKEGAALWQSLQ